MAVRRKRVQQHVWALYETGRVFLDGSGNGTVRLSPGIGRERWLITFINITCTQVNATVVPTMTMYRSSPVPQNRIGGSYNGLGDTNSTDQILLNMGEDVYFVWTGGDPGAEAVVRIEGSRYVWE